MRRSVLFAVSVLLVVPATVRGQLPQTRLGTLFPPGGEIGTSFEVRVTGDQDLEYATAPQLVFSDPSLTAVAVVDPETGAWQSQAFRVTVNASARPGRYDAFLAGYYGASNPRSFRIEAAPCHAESGDATPAAPGSLTIDAPLYGRVAAAGDVDEYNFAGRANETLVVSCDAASVDSPLQPVIELIGPEGRRLGVAGAPYRGEALLPATLRADGNYRVRVSDASYRGSEEFAYRLEVMGRPLVTAVRPPFDEAGAEREVELLGYNLPGGELLEAGLMRSEATIAWPREGEAGTLFRARDFDVDGFDLFVRAGERDVGPVNLFLSGSAPEREEGADAPEGQRVVIPTGIAGRFEEAGEADRYVFDAQAGDVAWVEVFADRYGSSVDPVLSIEQIAGPDGQQKERLLATADDRTESLAPGIFETAHSDPLVRFEAPENGRYRVTVRNRHTLVDHESSYRLSLRHATPDFRLVAVPFTRGKDDEPASPSGVSLRRGENVALTVHAQRRDGFDGPIHVRAEGLPAGLTTRDATIAEGQTSVPLVFTAEENAPAWLGPVAIAGEAFLPASHGRSAGIERRPARIGAIVRAGESRLASSLIVAILDESLPFRLSAAPDQVRVGQGSQVLVPLDLVRKEGFGESVAVAAGGLAGDSKITSEVRPFAADDSRQIAKLVADPQAPTRTHTVLFQGTSKIDYSKFPHRLARAKSSQERAAKAVAEAEQAVQAAAGARGQAAEALKAAEGALESGDEADKEAGTARVEAARKSLAEKEASVAAAQANRQSAEAAKALSDQALAEAEKVSAPQKIDYSSPAGPLTMSVVASPVRLTATPENGGAIKRGGTLVIRVTAQRQNGFDGRIRFSLALAPGSGGLSAAAIALEPGQSEGIVRVAASARAPEGSVLFPAVRAETEYNGPVRIDVPVSLTIVP